MGNMIDPEKPIWDTVRKEWREEMVPIVTKQHGRGKPHFVRWKGMWMVTLRYRREADGMPMIATAYHDSPKKAWIALLMETTFK